MTGAFFERSDPAALAAELRAFDRTRFDPARLRAHAETFAPARFVERLRAIVDESRQLAQEREGRDVAGSERPARGSGST